MRMRSVIIALACLMLFTGCAQTVAVYNSIDSIYDVTPMNIEGSYTEEMDADEFETLTGLRLQQNLPEAFAPETLSVIATYDKDGGIVNIQGRIGDTDQYLAFSAFSDELWSDVSYAPNFYRYGDDGTNNLAFTTIGQTEALFFRYDDSKKTEYKLGYDVYIADFKLNNINVYVESNAMEQQKFEQFVTSLIKTADTVD